MTVVARAASDAVARTPLLFFLRTMDAEERTKISSCLIPCSGMQNHVDSDNAKRRELEVMLR